MLYVQWTVCLFARPNRAIKYYVLESNIVWYKYTEISLKWLWKLLSLHTDDTKWKLKILIFWKCRLMVPFHERVHFCFCGILTLVVLDDFFIFWKNDFLGLPCPFLTIFLIYKGLLGARCKSGDLCWKGFVCRFWIYIVVRQDFFLLFWKKP